MSLARRLFRDLRTEGGGPGRDAAALALGTFIGCLPFYGFHLLLVAGAGHLFRLNRLKMYAAANISNPLMAPALIFAEIQAGAWLRRRDFHDLNLDAVRATDPWIFGGDLLLGSLAIGAALAAIVAAATWAAVSRTPPLPPHVERVFAAAADRYVDRSITAWEFARGKLRRDPIYRALLGEGMLPTGGVVVDIGCGQGLSLATLVEADDLRQAGEWPPGSPLPPRFDRLVGIETRARVAALASRALGSDAEVVHAAAPDGIPGAVSAALLFDVLHLMREDDQRRVMRSLQHALRPGGVVLVREVDAAAGVGFRAVRAGNRLKNLVVGNWRQTFHFRRADEWRALFAGDGWHVEQQPMGEGTPFANVLLRLTRRAAAPTSPPAS